MNEFKVDEQQVQGKTPHILIGIDIPNKYVFGMKGVGKYDEYETATVIDKNLEQFKLFENKSKFLSGFLFEFFSNMMSPEHYIFFTVPENKAVHWANKVQTNISNPTDKGNTITNMHDMKRYLSELFNKAEVKIDILSKNQFEKPQVLVKPKGRKM